MSVFGSSYLGPVYDPNEYDCLVRRVKENIEKIKAGGSEEYGPDPLEFDALAFRGTSGAALAYPLSFLTKIPLLSVRKDMNHHASAYCEGWHKHTYKKYAIIDDIVSTGETVQKIVDTIDNHCKAYTLKVPTCVGVFLYNTSTWSSIQKTGNYRIWCV